MTRKLCCENDTIESEVDVLQCEKLTNGRYGLRLNATPFHPQGGGQPVDIDKIGDAKVLAVEIVNGEIIHYYIQRMLALGAAVARVDAERRWQHSRLHSASHLINHVLESLAWKSVKAHH